MRKADIQSCFVKPGVAARTIGLAPNTIRAAVRRGDIPGTTIGTRVLVSRTWLEELTTKADRTVASNPDPVGAA